MKARINGTKDPFVEITEVSLANKPYVVYSADKIEFEQQQEQTSDHWQEPCKLNPEKDLSNPIGHWQDVRERAAIAAMQGISAFGLDDTECTIKRSIELADALVKELKGE